MGTTARIHYHEIVNDDTMDSWAIQDLIRMLESHLKELESDEAIE